MRAPQQSASTDALVLDQAITEAADAFARQLRNLAASMTRRDKRALVGDPMIDSGSGEHTALTGQIEREVGTRLTSNHTQLPVLPFQLASVVFRSV